MILQINFNVNVPFSEYEKLANSVAQAFVGVPGLRWKIWLANPSTEEAGGIYLFDSPESLEAYLNGPLVAQLKTMSAIRNVSIRQFQVMPDLTAITRGPVGMDATAVI